MTELETCLAEASEPPSEIPTWQWLEQNIELSPVMTDMPGQVSFEFFPASKAFLTHLDDPRLRKATVMKCSQSAFTENAIMYLLRRIKERPITTMWIGQNADKTQEDAKKRFWPAIASCKAIQALSPPETDKERWTRKLIMFDTMNLLIRGANSVGGLRGDPVGLIVCDERADWKPGRIHKARQRLTTKSAPVEISIGAAGKKNDELHIDWQEGSQTFIHFTCPHCHHCQPFRFGQEETTLFPEPRQLGGLVWDTNDDTKPNDVWNYEAVKKSTRYECEKCGHRFNNGDKPILLKSASEFHRHPSALPENFSLAVTGLLLIWEKRSWGDIAVEFLKAKDAIWVGDIEPMITFVQETLGEPWELRSDKKKQSELMDRCGEYKLGECWLNPKEPKELKELELGSVLVLTFDRQHFKIVYVVRQWRRNGDSRLIWCGETPSYDDLRAFQLENKIKNRCMWGDDGGRMTADFRQNCLRLGWNILKGEDHDHFSITEREKTYRQGWRQSEFDPGIGTSNQGRITVTAYLWSNQWFKDKLYNIFSAGAGPLWELPKDVPTEFVKQFCNNEWREKTMRDGRIEGYWHEKGIVDFADCELEQLVVVDIGGMTRHLPRDINKIGK